MAKTIPRKAKAVFSDLLADPGKSMADAMRDAGYSESSARNPQQLTRSKGWQELLSLYADDEIIIQRVTRALLSDDNRAALQAADMLLKLKDKYPAGKLKVQEYNDELERLKEHE